MKCRKVFTTEDGVRNIVWFGSYGKNQDGTAKFVGEVNNEKPYGFDDNGKHENYSIEQQGVCDDLIQRLNLIKGELWYNVQKGLPLFDKVKQKGFIDSYVIQTVLELNDVMNIISFDSTIENNHYYKCNFKVLTVYGELLLKNFINEYI